MLIRHAHAGDRGRWGTDDDARPLSDKGRQQAAALVGLVADHPVDRVLSSPLRRCVETVQPLAEARGLPVEDDEALAEGRASDAIALARRLVGAAAVLCTHGDVVPDVLGALMADGMRLNAPQRWAKGSVWLLHSRDGRFAHATYLTPAP
ncbi:MAG: SixA phosphatase family protein [Egibacteraceae bacterium]